MQEIIGGWVGKTVSVTLKVGGIATAVSFDGKLINVSDGGVLLGLPKGQTFVPAHSILHVSLLEEK